MGDSKQRIVRSSYYYADGAGVQPGPSEMKGAVTYYTAPSDTGFPDAPHHLQSQLHHTIGSLRSDPSLERHIEGFIGLQPSTAPHAEEETSFAHRRLETRFRAYELAMEAVFAYIISGRLAEASLVLMEQSEWLLGNVESLGEGEIIDFAHTLTSPLEGLHIDDITLHEKRKKLWDNLNTAWKTIFYTQKGILEGGPGVNQNCTLIRREYIITMGDSLVQMCDKIAKHGLVDYPCGVMEDEIVKGILGLLDYLEDDKSESS